MTGVLPEQVDRQAVGGRGAQGHQQIHVAGAGAHRLPAGAVEAPAQAELYGGGQGQLGPAAKHPGYAQPLQQHGRHQRHGQHRGQRHRPPVGQPGRRPRFDGHRGVVRRITRLADRRHQRRHRHAGQPFDRGPLGGQVDRDRRDARHLEQRLLDAADARGAGHVLDAQRGRGQRHLVAGPAHRRRQRRCGDFRAGQHRGLLGGQVDADGRDAGHGGQRLLDAPHARRAGHAADLEPDFGGLAIGGSRSACLGVHGCSAQGHAEWEAWIVDVPTVSRSSAGSLHRCRRRGHRSGRLTLP